MSTTAQAPVSPKGQPTVFIGSSTEALPVVNKLVGEMSPHFRARPWNQVFTSGEYTFEILAKEVERADAAVFVFAKDDQLGFRGQATYSTRDNVILEYGLFVSALGRGGVLVLGENGVKLPSDLLGISIDEFPAEEMARNAALAEFVQKAKRKWPEPRSRTGEQDARLGYARTLRAERMRLDEISEALSSFHQNRTPAAGGPIEFGVNAPLSTYSEALGLVQHRFWTTTFLSSGFWTRPHARVMEANQNMLNRVKEKNGEARRLFLLDRPPSLTVQAYSDTRVLQRQLHNQEELQRLAEEHKHLKNNMNALLAQGFEVKAVFDEDRLWDSIVPKEVAWNPRDSELALYDDFRFDIFEGGSTGVVHGVKSYSPASRYFSSYLSAVTEYFHELWVRAVDMKEFISELQEAVDRADSKIDYESNWLAIYEYALGKEDEELKSRELGRVEEELRQHIERGLTVRRFLDVGTCTARYPIRLREHVVKGGYILGVDEDFDCVRFAQANVNRACPDAIEITQCNFAARQATLKPGFDLITCMLGTLSHFGWDMKPSREDALQRVLDRMHQLLAPDGLLFLGTWSQYACQNRQMLGIYRQSDRERLSRWTVSLAELDHRLKKAGLEIVGRASPELRLDVTWCRRAAD